MQIEERILNSQRVFVSDFFEDRKGGLAEHRRVHQLTFTRIFNGDQVFVNQFDAVLHGRLKRLIIDAECGDIL